METMLGWPEVRGVAEVMDMHGVLHGSERMQEIVQAGLNSGKLIEGPRPRAERRRSQAYLAAGVTSDHELTSADDALEKLRAGLTIEIRGSHPYLLPDIVAALTTFRISPRKSRSAPMMCRRICCWRKVGLSPCSTC
jgi:Adenine deaminase (EC 3.5.4.2)